MPVLAKGYFVSCAHPQTPIFLLSPIMLNCLLNTSAFEVYCLTVHVHHVGNYILHAVELGKVPCLLL